MDGVVLASLRVEDDVLVSTASMRLLVRPSIKQKFSGWGERGNGEQQPPEEKLCLRGQSYPCCSLHEGGDNIFLFKQERRNEGIPRKKGGEFLGNRMLAAWCKIVAAPERRSPPVVPQQFMPPNEFVR